MPKHLKIVFGILLFGMVTRFASLIPHLAAGRMDFYVMRDVSLFILSLGVIKGFSDRSMLAWKTARVMTLLMLIFVLLGTCTVAVAAFYIDGLYPVIILFALAALLNSYVIWVLHSPAVQEYFAPDA